MKLIHTYGKHLLLPVIFLLLPLSCTERIDLELESAGPHLVVEGYVTSDSVRHQVQLTVSSDYFSNKAPTGYSGAIVEISFDDTSIRLEENDSAPGLYESPIAFSGIPGTTYHLDISQVDLENNGSYNAYHASSTMPGGAELDYIELRHYPTSILSGYVVFMYGSHLPLQRDWFGFKLQKNGDLLTDSLSKYFIMADDLFDDGYFPGLPVGFLNDNDPRQAVHSGDTVTLRLESIEKLYYEYMTSAQLEIAGNYPLFSGPPANVESNINNDAYGIFTAYSILRSSVIVP